MGLRKLKPDTWPADAGWLVPGYNCTPLGYAVVLRALKDVGILEVPLASNRGIRIDAMTKRAGLTVPNNPKTPGFWWCAIWAGAVMADAGSLIPVDYPATDKWLPYCTNKREIGSAVLYGVHGDAHHIGIVVRTDPMVLTIEGNRGFAGTTNNGVAVDIGPMLRTDILGYYAPRTA